MGGAVGGVGLLRLIGFMSTVFGVNGAAELVLPIRGRGRRRSAAACSWPHRAFLEPPAFLMNWIATLTDASRKSRRGHEVTRLQLMGGTLAEYFGLRFLSAVVMEFGRHLRAGRADRLHRNDAPLVDIPNLSQSWWPDLGSTAYRR